MQRQLSQFDARDSLTRRHQPQTQEAEITAALGARSIVLVGMMGAGKIHHRTAAVGAAAAAVSRRRYRDRGGGQHVDTGYLRGPWRAAFQGRRSAGDRAAARQRSGRARHRRRRLHGARRPRNRIGDKAVSIWLKADADIIMKRVKRRADRPLLQTGRSRRHRRAPDRGARAGLPARGLTIWSRDVPARKDRR